jgi:hypothetical protein
MDIDVKQPLPINNVSVFKTLRMVKAGMERGFPVAFETKEVMTCHPQHKRERGEKT